MARRYEPGTQRGNQWIRLARKSRGMSQQDLAKASGMTQVGISHIESRDIEPRRSSKQLLALTLGYTVDELFPPNGRTKSAELRALAKAEKESRR